MFQPIEYIQIQFFEVKVTTETSIHLSVWKMSETVALFSQEMIIQD